MCPGCTGAHDAHHDDKAAMDRRRFLKLSAAGVAGATLLGLTSSVSVMAQPDSSLKAEFEAAAEEFNVPVELLVAMGWVNTRWEMPPPRVGEYEDGEVHGMGLYGIMALVQNPSSDTLGEASELTGIPEDELKRDRASNIRGGAALLAKSRRSVPAQAANGIARAARAVEGTPAIDAIAGVGGGEVYQEQVIEALGSGVSGRTRSGERLEVAPQEGVE